MRDAIGRVAGICLALVGLAGLAFFCVSPHFVHAREDAVILFAYSTNLARTGVISYYAGGPRIEGATDFLWMVLLAAGVRLALNIYYFANILSALSVVAIAVLLLKIAGQRIRPMIVLAISGLVFLAPQTWAAVGGFSVFFFAAVLTVFVLLLLEDRMFAASLAGLTVCLIRPDGVVFVIPLLAMFLFSSTNRSYAVKAVLGLFVVPGVAYFLWRWHYFGEFLPLPYLVKSDTQRFAFYFDRTSVNDSSKLLLFTLITIAVACGWSLKRSINVKLLIGLIVVPTLFYVHMRLDQDIAFRFYFYLLLAAGILVAVNWPVVRARLNFAAPVSLVLWVIILGHGWLYVARASAERQEWPGLTDLAHELANVPVRGSMIATEAGIVPFYSNWIAYDAWGLNTPLFAHRVLQPSDVTDLHPDLILLHRANDAPCLYEPAWTLPYSTRTWEHMERNLIGGAHGSHYDLWLQPNVSKKPPLKYICWFVNRESADKAALESLMMKHNFLRSGTSDNAISENLPASVKR